MHTHIHTHPLLYPTTQSRTYIHVNASQQTHEHKHLCIKSFNNKKTYQSECAIERLRRGPIERSSLIVESVMHAIEIQRQIPLYQHLAGEVHNTL